jgi:hypothetical protein
MTTLLEKTIEKLPIKRTRQFGYANFAGNRVGKSF